MGEFFKGWKRKIGVATLVMACVATASWVRSLVGLPVFVDYRVQFEVVESGILIELQRGEFLAVNSLTTIGPSGLPHTVIGGPKEWFNWFVLPFNYWFIAIVLTLFSAYLLLSKPRNISEPVPDEES